MEKFVARLISKIVHPRFRTDMKRKAIDPTASEMFKNHLADKRTILAYLRTGIALLTLPLSMITILIATSSHYEVSDVLALFSTMLAISGVLIIVGIYMVVQSFRQLFAVNDKLNTLEHEFSYLSRWQAARPVRS